MLTRTHNQGGIMDFKTELRLEMIATYLGKGPLTARHGERLKIVPVGRPFSRPSLEASFLDSQRKGYPVLAVELNSDCAFENGTTYEELFFVDRRKGKIVGALMTSVDGRSVELGLICIPTKHIKELAVQYIAGRAA